MSATVYSLLPWMTPGTRRVNTSCNERQLVRVAWEITPATDLALATWQRELGVRRTDLVASACDRLLEALSGFVLPTVSAVAPQWERTVRTTWYARRSTYEFLREYSLRTGTTVQALLDLSVHISYLGKHCYSSHEA